MLGLKRGTVQLVPHNPEWRRLFEEEKQLLLDTFGDTTLAIEHVGSTAVPGLVAKPVLDMNVGVKSLEIAVGMKAKFEELGYEHRPFVPGKTKDDLKEQELYVKGPEAKRTHHVHVTVYDSNYWKKDLLFRDYLRSHPVKAAEYGKLKQKLAAAHADDRYTYTAKKEVFIEKLLDEARKENNL